MPGTRWGFAVVIAVVMSMVAACDSGSSASPGSSPSQPVSSDAARVGTTTTSLPRVVAIGSMAVGMHIDTYVDTSRTTPPNGAVPGAASRTMATTIWYPAWSGRPAPR